MCSVIFPLMLNHNIVCSTAASILRNVNMLSGKSRQIVKKNIHLILKKTISTTLIFLNWLQSWRKELA